MSTTKVPELPADALDLEQRYLVKIKDLLKQVCPHVEIWAYGSRVNGHSHEASDLDLVARQPQHLMQVIRNFESIREAFIESDIPIQVQIVDWARIPETFHAEIKHKYVVLQQSE